MAQKKIEDAERIRNSLARQIEEKKSNKIEEEKNVLDFELSNQRFNNMKNMFAEKRKEFTVNQALNRIKISEHISSWNVKAQQESELAQTKFLEAIGKGNNQRGKLEEEKKQKQREQFKKEQEQFLALHVWSYSLRNKRKRKRPDNKLSQNKRNDNTILSKQKYGERSKN
jgi:hypothetical protein